MEVKSEPDSDDIADYKPSIGKLFIGLVCNQTAYYTTRPISQYCHSQ